MNKNVRKAGFLRVQLSSELLRHVTGGGDGGVTAPVDVQVEAESEVVSPRDPASGLPTGKRMHKPFVIT